MKGKGYEYILLDLDGTITDSKEGLLESFEYGLTAVGFHDYTKEQLERFLGPPLSKSYKNTYGFDDETVERALAKFRERLAVAGVEKNKVYPGVIEFLDWAKSAGKKLIVATSKNSKVSQGAIRHCGLYDYFDMIAGKDEGGGDGAKEDVIAYVLAHFPGIEKDKCVMVGDRMHDVLGAKKMGMDSIGVLYGYGSREELETAKPDYLCENLEQVRRICEGE